MTKVSAFMAEIERRRAMPPSRENPLGDVLRGAGREPLERLARGLWRWLLAADQGLLPRALTHPPDLRIGIRLAPVVSAGYGDGKKAESHVSRFAAFMKHIGLPADASEVRESDVVAWDNVTWLESVAALLAHRSGHPACRRVARALRASGMPPESARYFEQLGSPEESNILVGILEERAKTEEERARALARLGRELDREPIGWFACNLEL